MPSGLISLLSPSALQQLRSCGYSKFLELTSSKGGEAPSNPWARLGTTAHEVLEWAATEASELHSSNDLERQARTRWAMAVERQAAASALHPSEAAFGPAATWPFGAMTEERTVIEVERLVEELARVPAERVRPEWHLMSESLGFRGTVDLCIVGQEETATLIDFKSGDVVPEQVEPGGTYWMQIMIYAALVQEQGLTPVSGEVRPIGRKPSAIPITQSDVIDALRLASDTLSDYNAAVNTQDQIRLARCTESACRWCAYTLDCEEYWTAPPELGDIVPIEGVITSIAVSQVGTVSLAVDVESGARRGATVIAGLGSSVVSSSTELPLGRRIRVAGLREGAPGAETLMAAPGTRIRIEP